MAARHPDLAWVFLYTREAHPGERVPAHETFEDKLAAARRLRDEVGIDRTILVDDLKGSCHRAYGQLPNMTWVIGRGGRILYKAAWTSAAAVEAFLERHAAARSNRQPGSVLTPFGTEQIEYREVDRDWFMRRLREGAGARAEDEFRRALEVWSERGDPT